MIVLACETSTLLGSVALAENGQILAHAESMRQGSHSDVVHPFIHKVLEQSGKRLEDIDLFATSVGPGSFTGIRISLNSMKSLAYCYEKPIYSTSSLRLLAEAAFSHKNLKELLNKPVISMINAYKNMCYVAQYRWQSVGLVEEKKPEVIRVQNLDAYVTETSLVCGDGYLTYDKFLSAELKNKIIRNTLVSDEPHAITLALRASLEPQLAQSWDQLLPLYLRASEAEENLKGIKYQPLT